MHIHLKKFNIYEIDRKPITTFSSAGNQLKGLLKLQQRENVSLIATTGTYNGWVKSHNSWPRKIQPRLEHCFSTEIIYYLDFNDIIDLSVITYCVNHYYIKYTLNNEV